jgi:hydrogenase expression/formation protein HypC
VCIGVPARILSVGEDHPDLARVDYGGVEQTIHIGLLDVPVQPGDWILVHMGFALSTMTAQQAADALDVFRDERDAEVPR